MTSSCARSHRARPLLGTRVSIRADGADARTRNAAIDAAFAVVATIHARMSAQAPDSDLAALHAAPAGAWRQVHAHTAAVLRAARPLAERSGGAFTPCPRYGDWRALELDGARARLLAPMALDLGGIAKGYAVDQAVAALQAAGIESGCVNAGGDLRVFGGIETAWIRDPGTPQRAGACVVLEDAALATSAAYFDAHALAVPRGGAHRAWSVSVIAPTALAADALTKVALYAPPALAEAILAEHDAEAHWLFAGAARDAA